MKLCGFDLCNRPSRVKGLCQAHYVQQRSGKPLTPIKAQRNSRPVEEMICKVDGCERPVTGRGLCQTHLDHQKAGKPLEPIVNNKEVRAEQSARGVWMCLYCEKELPATAEFFNPARKAGSWSSYCKPCVADKRLKDKYGLSQRSWDALFASQGNRCAICRTDEPGGQGWWHTDHSHDCCPGETTCGRCVRSIVCNRCNITLGYVESHPDLQAVMQYLAAPQYQLCDADYAVAAEFYKWDQPVERHLRAV